MKLDPVSLRLFVRVVEEGTIAAVAELEHIAAPAVSKRLRELEELFGTPLLVRTNKGITPTAAGVNLSILSRDVLDDLRNFVLQMKAFSDGLRGSVIASRQNSAAITRSLSALPLMTYIVETVCFMR